MAVQVLLLFGGESSEHEVSLVSARNVYEALDKEKYDVRLGRIAKDGSQWLLVNSFDDTTGVELFPMLGQQKFWTENGEISVDVLFPVLHGAHGEDGDVQGLARLMHIPCVGPSLIGAAVTMDKDVAKRLIRDVQIPVVDWIAAHASQPTPTYEAVRQRLGDVVFVKPANAGSSVGVSKAKDEHSYQEAVRVAFEHDALILIEKAVDAREIELAVLGNEVPEVTIAGEIIPGEEFYSYSDKYSEISTSEARIPADLSESTVEKLKRYAKDAYIATRGQGMARVDFFVDGNENIYLNEINSIPGFTNISMYPKLWQHEGLAYSELCDRLILLALEVNDYV